MKKLLLIIALFFAVVSAKALTYSVTVPAGTNACYIYNFTNGAIFQAMTKVDATHYSINLPAATISDTYKYSSGANWVYEETNADGTFPAERTYTAADVVVKWLNVYDPNVVLSNITYSVTVPSGTKTCYLAGDMNGWTFQLMNKVDATHFSVTFPSLNSYRYKYCSGPDWTYQELNGSGATISNRNYSASDVVLQWQGVYQPVPTITSFTPTTAAGGSSVTITGTNLTGTTAVSIGGTAVSSFTIVNDNNITAVVGTGSTGTISVTNPSGTATSSGTFTFIPAPTITSFTPTSAKSGATVIITGTNFTGASAVTFGNTAASSYTVNSATQITAIVGAGTTGTIKVTAAGGTVTSGTSFTFIPAPIITSFSPTSGGNGTTITINGINLKQALPVTIGGTAVSSITSNSDTQITVVVGTGTTGTISLTTAGGTANSGNTFTFVPAPTITSFTPTNGSNGNTVVITGTNLLTTTGVSIGGTAASSFTVNSDTQVTATIGSGATGTISLTTLGGTATSTGTFTYNIVSTAGGLASAITAAGYNLSTMTNLTFTGTIDARDFKTMRDDMPLLAVLDMSGATISAYTGTLGTGGTGSIVYPANEIPQNAFFNSSYVGKVSLISVAMPTSVTSIGIAAFTGCSGLTGSLTIPTSVTNIGSNAFSCFGHKKCKK